MTNRKDVARRGHDAQSQVYEDTYLTGTEYRPWLTDLVGRLPADSTVADLCCGLPVAATLTDARHRVTGVDLSEVARL